MNNENEQASNVARKEEDSIKSNPDLKLAPDCHEYTTWWLGGLRHRPDGPAVVCDNGHEEYFFLGEWLTKEQFQLVK